MLFAKVTFSHLSLFNNPAALQYLNLHYCFLFPSITEGQTISVFTTSGWGDVRPSCGAILRVPSTALDLNHSPSWRSALASCQLSIFFLPFIAPSSFSAASPRSLRNTELFGHWLYFTHRSALLSTSLTLGIKRSANWRTIKTDVRISSRPISGR